MAGQRNITRVFVDEISVAAPTLQEVQLRVDTAKARLEAYLAGRAHQPVVA